MPPAEPFPNDPKWGEYLLYTDVQMERREVRNYIRRLREIREMMRACPGKLGSEALRAEKARIEIDLRTRLVNHGAAWSEYLKAKRERETRQMVWRQNV